MKSCTNISPVSKDSVSGTQARGDELEQEAFHLLHGRQCREHTAGAAVAQAPLLQVFHSLQRRRTEQAVGQHRGEDVQVQRPAAVSLIGSTS